MLEEPVMWLRYRHFSHLQGMIMSAAKNMNNVNNIVRGGCSWRGPMQCNDLLPNGGLLKSNSGLPKLLEDQMKCDNKLEEIWSTFWEEIWSTFWRNLINILKESDQQFAGMAGTPKAARVWGDPLRTPGNPLSSSSWSLSLSLALASLSLSLSLSLS